MAIFNGSVENIENNKNKVNTISENPTQAQYPNVQAVIDYIVLKIKEAEEYTDKTTDYIIDNLLVGKKTDEGGEIFNHYEDGEPEIHNIDGNPDTPTEVPNYKNTAYKNATAMGVGNEANGEYSTTFGKYNETLGKGALAGGFGCTAYGDGSLAFGYFCDAVARYCIAIGNHALAEEFCALAIGQGAKASGQFAVALGLNAIASGRIASAFNSGNATGELSTGFGDSTAAGKRAIAGGNWSQALAENALAFGEQVLATLKNQVAFGQFNKTNPDALFMLGNGSSHQTRQNAFEILNTGAGTIQTQGNEPNSIVQKQYVDNLVGDIEALLGGI